MLTLFNTAILASTESMLNRLINLDPPTSNKLMGLQGTTLTLHCTSPDIAFHVQVQGSTLRLMSHLEYEADASITGSSRALMNLLTSSDRTAALHRPDIQVRGNMDKAQSLQAALAGMEIDWEYQLSKWIGDIPVQGISTTLEKFSSYASESSTNLRHDIDNYLHQEKRLFPEQTELTLFYQRINQLRSRIDRMEARLQFLEQSPD